MNNEFINVSDGNYCNDEDSVLYNKNKTTIICYPPGIQNETYYISTTITSIGNYAFYLYCKLETIIFGENL